MIIHDEDYAIYQVVYEYEKLNKDRNTCYFAWHVVGGAFCDIYYRNQQKQTICISRSLL